MLLMLAALSTAIGPPPAKVEQRAQVRIRILLPHRVSAKTWDPVSQSNQREIVKQEADGSVVQLRLTEFQ